MTGLREWLRTVKGWKETSDPSELAELDEWLGPRSQWGLNGREQSILDEQRTAARVFFGMPYQYGNDYRLKIFGFVPPEHARVKTAAEGAEVIEAYIRQLYGDDARLDARHLGPDLIAAAAGGAVA